MDALEGSSKQKITLANLKDSYNLIGYGRNMLRLNLSYCHCVDC